MTEPGQFLWYELMTRDVDAAIRFYGDVIGWAAKPCGIADVDYRIWSLDEAGIGGLMAIPAEAAACGMPPGWFGYIRVADVDASVARITAAGGTVLMPAETIEAAGRMAMVSDPEGAAFYVMAPAGDKPSVSFQPDKPGHAGWQELHARDGQAAFAFYRDQFGWSPSDALDMGEMGTYQLFDTGGEAIGGMMNSPGMPRPTWLYYFNVDDIEAAKARVEAAGGRVLMGPVDVPGGHRILQAIDPQEAMFALVGPQR